MSSHFRKTGILAVCLLALSALATALAQDGMDDASSSVEQDAKDVLGDRASPPDLSSESPPPGVMQADNAGSANFSIPTERTTETVTRTHESSSSFSMDAEPANQDNMPVAGEIRNNPPPPAGWPGSRHANRPQEGVTTIDAGPIWNNNDARGKCPAVCANSEMDWTGDWRTVGFNKSVCDCTTQPQSGYQPGYNSGGRGTYCEAPPNYQCAGCSVHCPGGQIAHCTTGDRGIFNKPDSTVCGKEAKCECK